MKKKITVNKVLTKSVKRLTIKLILITCLIIIFNLTTKKVFSQTIIYQTGFENVATNNLMSMYDSLEYDHWRTNSNVYQNTLTRCVYDQVTLQPGDQPNNIRNVWCFTVSSTFGGTVALNPNCGSITNQSLGISGLTGKSGTNIVEYTLFCDFSIESRNGVFCFFNNFVTDRWAYRAIPTTGYTGIQLTFDWKCAGSSTNGYGQVGYSLDGGTNWTWLTTGGTANGLYYGKTAVQTATTVNLPVECNNQNNLAIGFRFYGNGSGGEAEVFGPTFVIDNVIVKGTENSTCVSPTISSQPSGASQCPGTNVAFTVSADGTAPFSYQWKKNGQNIITNASNSKYSLTNISTADGGSYTCVVTNGCGTATSNPAILTVISQIISTTKFLKQIISQGASPTLSLNLNTTDVNYQWKKDGADIAGKTNSTLNLSSIFCDDAGIYSCNVSNACSNITTKVLQIYVADCYGRFRYDISGFVRYEDKNSTAMSSHTDNSKTNISLLSMGDTLIDETETDDIGFYVFQGIVNGDYKLKGSTLKKWGGSNPTDALFINKFSIGLYTIPDAPSLKKIAANVNNDKNINPTDALLINRRYIGKIYEFDDANKVKLADWIFSDPVIHIESDDFSKDLLALCMGDVNGDYKNIPAKNMYTPVNNEGILNISQGRQFDIPVYLNVIVELGAIGIKFQIPGSGFQVIGLKSDIQGLIYNITEDGVNIAWSADDRGLNITPEKPLFILKAIYTGTENPSGFQLMSESVLADFNADYIGTDKLVMPKIQLGVKSSDFGIQTYPNPFSSTTNINYTLPEDANIKLNVYNVLGEKIATLTQGWKTAGNYNLQFDGSALKQGIYYCKMEASNSNSVFTKTNILVITK